MNRIKPVDPAAATGSTKEVLDKVQQQMGRIPNMFLSLANSPAAANAYLNFKAALKDGLLDAKLREQIAIVAAETNQCEYCLSAHVAMAKSVGLSESEIAKAQDAQASDVKADAALTFVRNFILRRADLPDADIEELRSVGYSDGEITEIIANIAMNIYGNYFNHINQTEIDFPKVKLAFPA